MDALKKYKNAFFGLAVVGSVLGMVSDLFLLYTPGIRYEYPGSTNVDYRFLSSLSPEHVLMGQTIGLAAIPLHFFGFLIIFPLLERVSILKKIFLGYLAVLLLVYGIHYHGLILPTQELLKLGAPVDWLAYTVKPVETVVVIIYALISILLGYEIMKGRTKYPKCGIVALPLVSYLFFIGLYALQVPGFNAVMAAGLNLTFLIFFSYSFSLLNSKK